MNLLYNYFFTDNCNLKLVYAHDKAQALNGNTYTTYYNQAPTLDYSIEILVDNEKDKDRLLDFINKTCTSLEALIFAEVETEIKTYSRVKTKIK